MKLPCSIVRELIPNYIDGCTSEEASQLIKEHLDSCEECRHLYEEMKKPLPEETTDDIDYLKKIKRNNSRKMILTAGIVVIVCLLMIGIKLFLIGSTTTNSYITNLRTDTVKGKLSLVYEAFLDEKGTQIKDYTIVKEKNGHQKVEYKTVKNIFAKNEDTYEIIIPLEDVNSYIQIGDNVISKHGTVCESRAVNVVDSHIAYVGDNVGVANLIEIMNFEKYAANRDGNTKAYTIELSTDVQPYVITVNLNTKIDKRLLVVLKQDMKAILASIDNCNDMVVNDLDGEVLNVHYEEKIKDYEDMQMLLFDQDQDFHAMYN